MFARIRPSMVWIGASILGTGLLLSVISLVFTLYFGSVAIAMAYLRGEQLVIVPPTLDLGSALEDEERSYRLELVNLSANPLTVVGATASCGCILVKEDLPLRIPAHASAWLSGTVTFIGESDELRHSITVYSDAPQGGIASTEIMGRIVRQAQSH